MKSLEDKPSVTICSVCGGLAQATILSLSDSLLSHANHIPDTDPGDVEDPLSPPHPDMGIGDVSWEKIPDVI